MAKPTAFNLTSYHYTRVMQWLGEQLFVFTGSVAKLLWAIADKTYKYRKVEDVIPIPQFQDLTGLCRQTVCDAIQEALNLMLINRVSTGRGYKYSLNIPDNLFNSVDNLHQKPVASSDDCGKPVESSTALSTPPTPGGKNFSNPLVAFLDAQIKDVTDDIQEEHPYVVDNYDTLTEINEEAPLVRCYPLQNLTRWARRAAQLGFNGAMLRMLWEKCKEGSRPIGLLLERLSGDGRDPALKPPKTLTKQELRQSEAVRLARAACD